MISSKSKDEILVQNTGAAKVLKASTVISDGGRTAFLLCEPGQLSYFVARA
jgi:hypothetical protein